MANASTILFLVVDDLGTADLGYTGSQIRTPTLDALAAGGTVLSSYYVQRACTPTRAALLTGRYPLRYGFQSGVLEPRKAYGLPLNETLVPQLLRSAGWATHAIGKWHLGFYRWEHTPTFRGFDSYYGYYTGGEDYFSHVAFGGGYDLRLDGSPRCGAGCSRVLWEANGTYSTHLFARRAVDVIRATPTAQKLYLYLATQAVHCPAQAPPEYIAPYKFANPQRNVFAGMLAALDEGIANVSAALRRAGRWEHSLVVVTADNGAPTTGRGGAQGGQNWPYRGGKCSAWEGGLRAVSFAHGPALGVRAGAAESASWSIFAAQSRRSDGRCGVVGDAAVAASRSVASSSDSSTLRSRSLRMLSTAWSICAGLCASSRLLCGTTTISSTRAPRAPPDRRRLAPLRHASLPSSTAIPPPQL